MNEGTGLGICHLLERQMTTNLRSFITDGYLFCLSNTRG